MGHSNAPLTPEGRRRLIDRIEEGRPISHVADEAGVSRKRLGVWYRRWQKEGDAGLEWLYIRAYMGEEARREALIPFLNEYNHRRPHSSLGNRPPISRITVSGPELELGVPLSYEIREPHEPTLPFGD